MKGQGGSTALYIKSNITISENVVPQIHYEWVTAKPKCSSDLGISYCPPNQNTQNDLEIVKYSEWFWDCKNKTKLGLKERISCNYGVLQFSYTGHIEIKCLDTKKTQNPTS